MMPEPKKIFLFQNIRQVIRSEEWCRQNGITVRVLPVPRNFSSECGMCLEVDGKYSAELAQFSEMAGFVVKVVDSGR